MSWVSLLQILGITLEAFEGSVGVPDAIYKQILDAVTSALKGLSLTGIDTTQIQTIKVATENNPRITPPGIFVSPVPGVGETLPDGTATNAKDAVDYPVLVTFVDNGNGDQTTNLDRWLQWREDVRSHFSRQRLSGVTEVLTCNVDPREVYHAEAFKKSAEVGFLILRFLTREPRG